MVQPYSSNFRVITTNFLGVRIFRKFTVVNKVLLSMPIHPLTIPHACTFSSGINFSGITLSRYHLKLWHFNLSRNCLRSVRSPQSLSCKKNPNSKWWCYMKLQKNTLYFTINPHLPGGLVHPYQLDESISNFRGVWSTFSFLFYFEKKHCRPWSDAMFCSVWSALFAFVPKIGWYVYMG